jgi:hypothetical protein
MMKTRMRPTEAMRTGMENQDSEMAREENGMATTTTTVPSTPNTASSNSQGGRDKDTQDKGWERMTMRGRGGGYAGGRDGRDGACMQDDTHHHGAQGMAQPPG